MELQYPVTHTAVMTPVNVLTQKGSFGPHSFSISVTAGDREPPESLSPLQVEPFLCRPAFLFRSVKGRSLTLTCHTDRYVFAEAPQNSLCFPPSHDSVDRPASGNAPLLPLCRETRKKSGGELAEHFYGRLPRWQGGAPPTRPRPLRSLSLCLSLSLRLMYSTRTMTRQKQVMLLSHVVRSFTLYYIMYIIICI